MVCNQFWNSIILLTWSGPFLKCDLPKCSKGHDPGHDGSNFCLSIIYYLSATTMSPKLNGVNVLHTDYECVMSRSKILKDQNLHPKSKQIFLWNVWKAFCRKNASLMQNPRISWFLIPTGYHKMWGSWISRTLCSLNPLNWSKKCLNPLFS